MIIKWFIEEKNAVETDFGERSGQYFDLNGISNMVSQCRLAPTFQVAQNYLLININEKKKNLLK